MTRLNYSNLPPEAQQAIQKLTGSTHEELEGKKFEGGSVKGLKREQAKPQTFKAMGYQLLVYLVPILIILGIVWLIAFIATMG